MIKQEAEIFNEPIITHLKNTLLDKRKIFKCVYALKKSDKKKALKAGRTFDIIANSESEARSTIEVMCKSFNIKCNPINIALFPSGFTGNLNENQLQDIFDKNIQQMIKIVNEENNKLEDK